MSEVHPGDLPLCRGLGASPLGHCLERWGAETGRTAAGPGGVQAHSPAADSRLATEIVCSRLVWCFVCSAPFLCSGDYTLISFFLSFPFSFLIFRPWR